MKSYVGLMLNFIQSIVGSVATRIRSYSWDGVTPLAVLGSWVEFFADSPYYHNYDTGSVDYRSSWLDVRSLSKITVVGEVTGAGGASGNVVIAFEGSFDVRTDAWTRSDLALTIAASGTTTVKGTAALDLSGVSFLRVKGVTNSAGTAVNVRVYTTSAAKPISLE